MGKARLEREFPTPSSVCFNSCCLSYCQGLNYVLHLNRGHPIAGRSF